MGEARLETAERDLAKRSKSREEEEEGVKRAEEASRERRGVIREEEEIEEEEAAGECRNSEGRAGRFRRVAEEMLSFE
jgi:hypothetical protein